MTSKDIKSDGTEGSSDISGKTYQLIASMDARRGETKNKNVDLRKYGVSGKMYVEASTNKIIGFTRSGFRGHAFFQYFSAREMHQLWESKPVYLDDLGCCVNGMLRNNISVVIRVSYYNEEYYARVEFVVCADSSNPGIILLPPSDKYQDIENSTIIYIGDVNKDKDLDITFRSKKPEKGALMNAIKKASDLIIKNASGDGFDPSRFDCDDVKIKAFIDSAIVQASI